jgi:hypothetical protein
MLMRKKLPPDESPLVWLWDEIARRVGAEAAAEIRDGYNERNRQYELNKRLARFRREVASIPELLTYAEERGDDVEVRSLQRQLAHRKAVLTAVEHETRPAFTLGQAVIWLSGAQRTRGSHLVDGAQITPTEAVVVKATAYRVQIRTVSTGGKRLHWVQPKSLRDLETWQRMLAEGRAIEAYYPLSNPPEGERG